MSNPYDGIWTAWMDVNPDARPWVLHVKGRLQMPSPGYTLNLDKREPQNNPAVLMLELIVVPPDPDAVVSQVVTEENVIFEESTGNEYGAVHILPDGPEIPVELVD